MFKEIKGIKEFLKAIKNDKYFHPSNFSADTIKNAKKDIYCFIWKYESEKIIGMWMLRGWDEGYKIPSFGMIVHPHYRGLGIGTKMLNAAIKKCKELKCENIRLTVDTGNEVALGVYLKAGFKFKGRVGFKKL